MKHAERVKAPLRHLDGPAWAMEEATEELDAMQSALDDAVAKLAARDAEVERLKALATCACGDMFTTHDPGVCGACVAGQDKTAEVEMLCAEVAAAIPAMREYARRNPVHHFGETPQDPNGVHAWLARNDRPSHALPEEVKGGA